MIIRDVIQLVFLFLKISSDRTGCVTKVYPAEVVLNFFKDKDDNWWSTFFGNDSQSPWREKPGLIKVSFEKDGKVVIAKDQPFGLDQKIVVILEFWFPLQHVNHLCIKV